MSRNLCSRHCDWCYAPPASIQFIETPRPAVEADCGFYWKHHCDGTFWVAHADCIDCGAKYLAWVAHGYPFDKDYRNDEEQRFFDLSYRAAFNDEPAAEDVPGEDRELSHARSLFRQAERMLTDLTEDDRFVLVEDVILRLAKVAKP